MPTYQHGFSGEVREVSLEDAAWYEKNPPWCLVKAPDPLEAYPPSQRAPKDEKPEDKATKKPKA